MTELHPPEQRGGVPAIVSDHCPLSLTPARSHSFTDQSEDALVADPMIQELDQPLMVNRIKEPFDVSVQHPTHLLACDRDTERVERVVP